MEANSPCEHLQGILAEVFAVSLLLGVKVGFNPRGLIRYTLEGSSSFGNKILLEDSLTRLAVRVSLPELVGSLHNL